MNKEVTKLLEDFANPKKWELLGGHYYRCRGKSNANTNPPPHEMVKKAITLIEAQTAELASANDGVEHGNEVIEDSIKKNSELQDENDRLKEEIKKAYEHMDAIEQALKED